MTFWIGIIGALILVAGAAYPEKKVSHPARAVKNWLFALGGLLMLIYSVLNYFAGGSIFFIFLQGLVNVSSVLMLLDVNDRVSVWVILGLGLGLTVWSLSLFEGYSTLFFIAGLLGIAVGYVLNDPLRRNGALLLGSVLIAVFSTLSQDWIFVGLNIFFALFCARAVLKAKARA